jgi:predicted O-linked N-acetylglucosamine transferase (SPINDLY family)
LLLSYLRRFTEADASFRQAEQIQVGVASAYFQGIKYDPDLIAQLNPRLFYMEMASELAAQGDTRLWGHFSNVLAEYLALTPLSDIRRTLAFRVFAYPVSPELRLRLMQQISSSVSCSTEKLYGEHAYQYHGEVRSQLRIGYLSADFYQHPTSILTRQLYRLHDRLKFRVYAYAIVPSPIENDSYRAEISENCDVFRDVSDMSDLQIADMINADGIDILVDLGQYATVDGRLSVLALRPAPVQINYLAFMATTGAEFIDYALVDHHVVPDDFRDDWSEKLIRLPGSLFLFDNQISNVPTSLTRSAQGLPEEAVVFCCFNNDYKIDPEIFTVWMNILREVPDAVLWLLGSSDQAKSNLRKAALQHGVAASRLIFGGRIELNLHMQRYQLADIFLDTYWFNGHTTTLEALWQGLPVLTRRGDVTSSRVAASFLEVLGLQEMITDNYTDYQQKAILYAKNLHLRHDLKQRLLQARQTSGLFNTHHKVRQIELAYEMVWSRHYYHMRPSDIDIPDAANLSW